MRIQKLIERLKRQKPRENERGDLIYPLFMPSDRYCVDFADDFAPDWQQFDTDQDAHYFGMWLNRAKLLTLTYCEGDWSLVICSDAEHYNAEVQDAIEFYGAGKIATVIDFDANTSTTYRQDRSEFLIAQEVTQ